MAITPDSKLAVGDMIPIAATVDISGEHLWVGYVENEVVQMVDTENENVSKVWLCYHWFIALNYRYVIIIYKTY